MLAGVSLTLIGFLMSQKLTLASLWELGRSVIAISVREVAATALLVFSVLLAFGVQLEIAALLTQPMSNAAAALVLLPIAISTAEMLGVNARPVVIIVTLSASLSFITPPEPASRLVFGVGKYRFSDFLKVGLPLMVIVVVMLVFLVPLLWPFQEPQELSAGLLYAPAP